ncbi:MAG: helix-turn-helix domain-containing protein [Candidatus Micrarchaeota archaeon]
MLETIQTPESALKLKAIFTDLVPGFGINHARIYNALLTSDTKTASDLIVETGVNQATTYTVLRELLAWELIQANNTTPTVYYTQDPLKTLDTIQRKRSKEVENSKKELANLIEEDTPKTDSIIIKIGQGEQTKLIHSITKKELKFREEILPLKQLIDELAADAPTKKTEYGQTKILAH